MEINTAMSNSNIDTNTKIDNALVSIKGPDKVGLISAVAGRLFDLGINFAEISFSVLDGNAEFSAVCQLHGETNLDTLKSELSALEQLNDCEISVIHFVAKSVTPATQTVSHIISISGADGPGLLARLCEVFQQFNANIVQLNSERIIGSSGEQFVISVAVSIPPDAVKSCLAHISNTAGELGLSCEWSSAED